MFKINNELCVGCGLCRDNCPQDAISLRRRLAVIDQALCNRCGTCAGICPRGAVVPSYRAVSVPELKDDISCMRRQADDLLARIEKLANSRC
jgi:heterodisulfide reductase subunit A-like polyferredoxin